MFKPVSTNPDFPKLEEEILEYWKKNKIFEKSVSTKPEDKTWTFLDGPPFITGLPHYGSLLSSIPKDVFPRFWTMKGYRVRRVWGWDCHGLPAENKVENKLKIERKKDIEDKIGVKKFIDECKLYVSEVSGEWEWYIDHIGRWVDFKNSYRTMDLPYMESVMWVFKTMYDKGFIYKGLRVSLYCPHCATPISNFEVAMDADNYKELNDPATTYKYQLADEKNTYILAWSTTPWNKIVTPALAVNPKLTYITVEQNGENYILAESTIQMLGETQYKIVSKIKGSELVGKKYVPHYDYYKIDSGKKAFEIIGGDFVTADEGTGVVTIAAYGEEDLKAMKENNIHIEMHLDEEGTIKPEVPLFGGMYYLKANKHVNADLQSRGLIYQTEDVPHNVPLCWRCHTRLYYAPQDAWYVDVSKLKDKMKKSNELVNWFPSHFKHGRFLKSMEAAPDWCISRSRYWGSPVPVWECTEGHRFVPGSIKELEEASGTSISDLHKPAIDEVKIPCTECSKLHVTSFMTRVNEVLDSWIEAGSASFAERHYPFESEGELNNFFPPDFIGEYTGQIRAWFYVLHVIANALNLREDGMNILSKNVVVEGVILGTDGRKMSKNYGNYPDPKEMIGKYGGDALRLYLMGSPVMKGEDIIISEEQYKSQVRGIMLVFWNIYNFFITYANAEGWEKPSKTPSKSSNVLDRWILSLTHQLVKDVTSDLEQFDTISAINHAHEFINKMSTWYIRRSRDRVRNDAEDIVDKNAFFATTYETLITLAQVLAPLAPFLAESIYKNLTDEVSVHLSAWPIAQDDLINKNLEVQMDKAIELASKIHAFRKDAQIKVRIPFKKLIYSGSEEISTEIMAVLLEEVNVKELEYAVSGSEFQVSGRTDESNLEIEEGKAREIARAIQAERKKMGLSAGAVITVEIPEYPKQYEEFIKKRVNAKQIRIGDKLKIEIGQ